VGEAEIAPFESAKVLAVVFDMELTLKEHAARAAKRGWTTIQTLSRLKGIRPITARQLYIAKVTSQIDYAAAAWYTPNLGKEMLNWM
jgi:hypothetical protein